MKGAAWSRTAVSVTPASFLIRAKDKQGNPVEMVIGPDSFTEVAIKPAAAPSATTQAVPKAPNATAGTTTAPKS